MKLLDRFRGVCAQRHFSPRTVDCYEMWIRQFLGHFRGADGTWRHPRELHGGEVGQFLTHLAQRRRLSASSQNQAMNAIVFLYRQVLVGELGADHLGRIDAVRVRRPAKVPTVLSVDEVVRVIEAVPAGSTYRLMVELLYGCGLRLMECCTLTPTASPAFVGVLRHGALPGAYGWMSGKGRPPWRRRGVVRAAWGAARGHKSLFLGSGCEKSGRSSGRAGGYDPPRERPATPRGGVGSTRESSDGARPPE